VCCCYCWVVAFIICFCATPHRYATNAYMRVVPGNQTRSRNIIGHCNVNVANEAHREAAKQESIEISIWQSGIDLRESVVVGRGERRLVDEHKNHCNSHTLNRNAASCSACGNFCNYSADPKQLPSAMEVKRAGIKRRVCVVCGANGACG